MTSNQGSDMGKRLELSQESKYIWKILKAGVSVAEFYLDHIEQMQQVVLSRSIEPKDRLEVLQLALSHAMLYMRSRDRILQSSLREFARPIEGWSGGDPVAKSKASMNFSKILPVVRKAAEKDLRRGLDDWEIEVVDKADLRSPQDIVQKVTLSLSPRVTFISNLVLGGNDLLVVTFTVRGGVFTFWKGYFNDNEAPAQHPTHNGKKRLFSLNGATCSVPGNRVVERIHPPKGSTSGTGMGWCVCTHPYRAQGAEFSAILRVPRLLGNAGEQELKDILLAALGKSRRYIEVGQFGSSRR